MNNRTIKHALIDILCLAMSCALCITSFAAVAPWYDTGKKDHFVINVGRYDEQSKAYFVEPKGDVTGNTIVSVSDAKSIMLHVAGLSILPDDKLIAADTNSDGKITTSDVKSLLRIVAGLDTFRADLTATDAEKLYVGGFDSETYTEIRTAVDEKEVPSEIQVIDGMNYFVLDLKTVPEETKLIFTSYKKTGFSASGNPEHSIYYNGFTFPVIK